MVHSLACPGNSFVVRTMNSVSGISMTNTHLSAAALLSRFYKKNRIELNALSGDLEQLWRWYYSIQHILGPAME